MTGLISVLTSHVLPITGICILVLILLQLVKFYIKRLINQKNKTASYEKRQKDEFELNVIFKDMNVFVIILYAALIIVVMVTLSNSF